MTINNDPNIFFGAQNNGGTRLAPPVPVSVFWGDAKISDITGPTPFVDISNRINLSSNGTPESVTSTITLTGKILRATDFEWENPEEGQDRSVSDNKGISGTLEAVQGLEKLFKKCPINDFKIKCSNPDVEMYVASGARLVDLSFSRTENNWGKTVDFTISLEKTSSVDDDPTENVTERSETWSIEPLDETVYAKFITKSNLRSEWSNPNMKPVAPSINNTVPPGAVGAQGAGSMDLQILSVPQFRITRRLSAKGISPPITPKCECTTNLDGSTTCTEPNPNIKPSKPGDGSWLSAKLWVDQKLNDLFSNSRPTGLLPYFTIRRPTSPDMFGPFPSTYLYDHNRSINIDISNGTYEATDTWLAMPTGMPYIETYTVETSTSLEMIKTVRVAGSVQGLSIGNIDIMDGGTTVAGAAIFPTGMSPTGNTPPGEGLTFPPQPGINLGYSLRDAMSGSIRAYNLPDVGSNIMSANTQMYSSKYINALSGWLHDIKPYMYRRASMAMNSADRKQPYVPAYETNPPKVPENPIYATESLLSVIPVSTTEGHDPKKGTISFTYEYNNKFNVISGVISENITITNDGPADTIAETQVPGRELGPIMTKTGTTATKKTINIEVVVMTPTGVEGFFVNNPSCPLYTGGYIYTTINKLIEGYKPFGIAQDVALFGRYAQSKNQFGQAYKTSDQDTWTPTQGRYNRTVSWIYQQCSNQRFYLDH
jgi:hypothetical protein